MKAINTDFDVDTKAESGANGPTNGVPRAPLAGRERRLRSFGRPARKVMGRSKVKACCDERTFRLATALLVTAGILLGCSADSKDRNPNSTNDGRENGSSTAVSVSVPAKLEPADPAALKRVCAQLADDLGSNAEDVDASAVQASLFESRDDIIAAVPEQYSQVVSRLYEMADKFESDTSMVVTADDKKDAVTISAVLDQLCNP